MDITSIIFIVVNIALLSGTVLLWYTQKFYKTALVFAMMQLGAVYFALQYFHLSLRELMLVMTGFYAVSVLFAILRMRKRLNIALMKKKHLQDQLLLHLKESL